LLGAGAGWELFGLGPGSGSSAIEFCARPHHTRTALPALQRRRAGVVCHRRRRGALVRPVDFVAGYLIPDGRPARVAPGGVRHRRAGVPRPGPAASVGGERRRRRPDGAGRDGRAQHRCADRRSPAGSSPLRRDPPTRPGTCSSPGLAAVYDVRPGRTSRVHRRHGCWRSGPPAG